MHFLLLTGLFLGIADGGSVDAGASFVDLGSLRWRLPAGLTASKPAPHFDDDGPFGPAAVESTHATTPDGATLRLVRLSPQRPVKWPTKEADVLDAWRRFHGCTTRLVKTRNPLFSAPQVTFVGDCKGGDSYALRVLRLEEPDGSTSLYEFHVDRPVMAKGRPLEDALEGLARAVELRNCAPSSFYEAARVDGGVRVDLDEDGKDDLLRVTAEDSGSGFSSTDVEVRLSSHRAPIALSLQVAFTAFLGGLPVPKELEGPSFSRARKAIAAVFSRAVCRAPDASLEWLLKPGLRWKPGRPELPDTYVLATSDEGARTAVARLPDADDSQGPPREVFLSYLGANHARGDAPFQVLDRQGALQLQGTAHGVVLFDETQQRHAWLYVHEGGEKLRWPSITGASFREKDAVIRTRAIDGKSNEVRVDLSTGQRRP
ncbi:MAG: hypothetical protein AB1938_12815 [Myxococcota bacterium]